MEELAIGETNNNDQDEILLAEEDGSAWVYEHYDSCCHEKQIKLSVSIPFRNATTADFKNYFYQEYPKNTGFQVRISTTVAKGS
jgi:hypothetical protein